MRDLTLQYLVGWKADGVVDTLRLEEFVDTRHREGGVAAEVYARGLALGSSDDGLEDILAVTGAVNVTGTKRASFAVPDLVENEEWMVTRATEVVVPNTLLLLAVGRTRARIHVQYDLLTGPATTNTVDPTTGEVSKSAEISRCCKPLRLKVILATVRAGSRAYLMEPMVPGSTSLRLAFSRRTQGGG
jgi:hypothetical protein